MQTRMVIYLHTLEPLQASWVVFDDKGHIIQSVAHAPLTEGVPNAEVIVVIPTQDVLLTQVNLPKLNRQRLMQALPFALEEQLLADLDSLHFAIGPYQTDNLLPVAVIAKQKLEHWLTALKTLNISPVAMIPLVFALPTAEKTWYINSHADTANVRTGKFTGFACEQANLQTLLDLNLFEEKDKEAFQRELMSSSEQQLLEKMSLDIPINLLQGSFQPKRQTTHAKKIWMLAACLTLGWVTLALFSTVVSFFILQNQVSHTQTAINKIYKQHFPQASSVVAPRQRMEEKIKTTFAQANKNNFLALLSIIAESMPANSIHLQILEFRDKQLSLEVSAANFDILDAFSAELTKQGLTVKRQNAATAGEQVKANLQISAGTA